MNPIGIGMLTIPGMTPEDFVREIAGLGFAATFDQGRKSRETLAATASACASFGVQLETLHAPWDNINAIWLPGEEGRQMLEKLMDTVDKCHLVGAPIAVVHLSSGQNPPTVTDVGRSRFAALVEYAQKKGVKIAFENQRKLFNLAWALETFGPEDGVGFCWDCGHEGCFTPGKQFMPWFADRLICTHIHDNYGIFDDDRHLLPFDGKLDFDRVARQLREANWQGNVMLEVILGKNSHYKGCNYENLTPQQYLARAAQAAKRLAGMI